MELFLTPLLLLLLGISLSAFFSGAETGFYRATRTRLALDALGGDPIAVGLIRLTNNPALFVATTLIGNNLANYLTSWAIVLGARHLANSHLAELVAPILLSPLVFVYGELLPKNLFFQAPNRLLRMAAPLFLICTVLFVPLSAVLWILSRILQSLVGEAPERLQLKLARNELQRVLEEGHQAGVLSPSQRRLADGLFEVANQPVLNFCLPASRVSGVQLGTPKTEVLRFAHRQKTPHVIVSERRERKWIGYVSVIDLYLNANDPMENIRPLLSIGHDESPIAALTRMQSKKEPIAQVVDDTGRVVGVLSSRALTEPLFRGQKGPGAFSLASRARTRSA